MSNIYKITCVEQVNDDIDFLSPDGDKLTTRKLYYRETIKAVVESPFLSRYDYDDFEILDGFVKEFRIKRYCDNNLTKILDAIIGTSEYEFGGHSHYILKYSLDDLKCYDYQGFILRGKNKLKQWMENDFKFKLTILPKKCGNKIIFKLTQVQFSGYHSILYSI